MISFTKRCCGLAESPAFSSIGCIQNMERICHSYHHILLISLINPRQYLPTQIPDWEREVECAGKFLAAGDSSQLVLGDQKWVVTVPLVFPTSKAQLPSIPHVGSLICRGNAAQTRPFAVVTVTLFAHLCSESPLLQAGAW